MSFPRYESYKDSGVEWRAEIDADSEQCTGWTKAVKPKIFLVILTRDPIICTNNTPQAYPAARCREAQTGGLIVSGVCYAL